MALHTLPHPAISTANRAATLSTADQARLRRYAEYLEFYNGRHWPKARQGRSNLALNYARAIVDKGVSYLFGRGVNFAVPEDEDARGQGNAEREKLLYRVFEENDLEAVDLQGRLTGRSWGIRSSKSTGSRGWDADGGLGDAGRGVQGRIRV